MQTHQPALRLYLPRLKGEPRYLHAERVRDFNNPPQLVPKEKLLADLLKRQAKRVMADITECPPDTLPAHLARLDALRELIAFATNHELLPGAETRRSSNQLLYAYTVADFAACLEITRRSHRAPAFINQRDADIAAIRHGLDTLAGLFSQSSALRALLDDESGVAS